MTGTSLRGLPRARLRGRLGVSAVLWMLLVGAAGCSEPDLLLYCGAGIRPPVSEITKEFGRRNGVTVECDYAGSEMLLSRITLTRRGDLYMPGDVHYVELAEKEGLINSKQTVCYFIPVIMVQKGNPKGIKTLADLTKPGIKVGLGDPKVCAIGRKSSKIFKKNNISEDDINRNVEFRSLTVNELGNHIKLDTLDAVIVWDAVAAYFPDDGEVVPIPRDQNIISTVAIGTLKSTNDPELAAKFVEFLTSGEAKEVFKKYHYTTKLPEEKEVRFCPNSIRGNGLRARRRTGPRPLRTIPSSAVRRKILSKTRFYYWHICSFAATLIGKSSTSCSFFPCNTLLESTKPATARTSGH